MRLLCLLLLLGLLVLLSFLSNHAGFDARAQQLLICFVLDRHLRSSVCGTRPRTGPHSWRRFAFFEDNSTARAELPILVYVCGGGPKRKHQEDTLPSQYGSLMDSFCKRTQRTWVEEIGDGHCGIRSFWRQFDETIGTGTASINSGHIRNGREKLASALRTYSSSIVHVLVQQYGGMGGITSHEIKDRADLHERCDADSMCDSSYCRGVKYSTPIFEKGAQT